MVWYGMVWAGVVWCVCVCRERDKAERCLGARLDADGQPRAKLCGEERRDERQEQLAHIVLDKPATKHARWRGRAAVHGCARRRDALAAREGEVYCLCKLDAQHALHREPADVETAQRRGQPLRVAHRTGSHTHLAPREQLGLSRGSAEIERVAPRLGERRRGPCARAAPRSGSGSHRRCRRRPRPSRRPNRGRRRLTGRFDASPPQVTPPRRSLVCASDIATASS